MFAPVIFTLAGIIPGIITGLIPGIHINTVTAVLLGAFYRYNLPALPLAFFVLGIAISHSFVGFVPSIFLGAPNEATVLSVAPGHWMLQKGRGYEALYLVVSGGIMGLLLLALLFPILIKAIPAIYGILRPSIQYILILAVSFLILKEKRKLWAFATFLFSGAFGIIALSSGINSSFALLPVLSGLFGISTLALSYFTESSIPPQQQKVNFGLWQILPGSVRGLLGGLLAGILPGIGSSQSAILAAQFTRKNSTRAFMVMLGAIAVCDILLSVLAIYLIGNPRSGAAVAIESMLGDQIDMALAITFLGAGIFASGISAYAALKIGAKFQVILAKISYKKLVISALFALLAVIWHFTGIEGMLVAITGAFLGAIPNFAGVKKSLLLGCLILPTLLYFFGISLY